MASFKSGFLLSVDNEGGYANRGSADYGGETYVGITRRWFKNWPGWTLIDEIKKTRKIEHDEFDLVPLEMVESFYKAEFWDKLGCDKLKDQIVANMLFDHAITSGVQDTVKMVQVSVGAKVDGIMGEKTRDLINDKFTATAKRPFRHRLFLLRVCYYAEQAKKSLVQEANFPSWVSRSVRCYA